MKALKAVRTSPLVRQCQKALNNISAQHVVGLFWVPGQAGVRGNEITDELTRDSSVIRFVGPELMKPLPTMFASAKLWLHSDMRIWAPSSWSQRTLRA